MAKTARDSFKFMLRLPDELREALKTACEESGRSMTAEIIYRLEWSFDSQGQEFVLKQAQERNINTIETTINALKVAQGLSEEQMDLFVKELQKARNQDVEQDVGLPLATPQLLQKMLFSVSSRLDRLEKKLSSKEQDEK